MNHNQDFVALCQRIKPQINEIDCTTTAEMMTKQEVVLIDVRDGDEHKLGAIPNAFHLSKGWIEAKIHQLVSDKNQLIVLYCGGGNRSALAAYNLQQMGYQQVYSLIGGYKAWLLVKGTS